jgi:hypothetical protein
MRSRLCLFLAAVPLSVGLMTMVSADPSSAATNSPNADCTGGEASHVNQVGPGAGGEAISNTAQIQPGLVGMISSTDCGTR